MGSSTKTAVASLSQFGDNDKPTWRGDYNGDMLNIDTAFGSIEGRATSLETRATALETGKVDKSSTTVVNVRAYGAKGDGVTDDRAAIQAALDAAGVAGAVYFPPGTYALKTKTNDTRILVSYASQLLYGAGRYASQLKVGDNFGNYSTVIGMVDDAAAHYCGNWEMRDLGVDQNCRGGNTIATATKATYPKTVIRLGSYVDGSSVSVHDCMFNDSDSINVLYAYADTLEAIDNHFIKIGGPVATTVQHDHSTIYYTATCDGSTMIIAGNTMRGVLGSPGCVTAIETHGGIQTVTGNTISCYLAVANLTGIDVSLAAGTYLDCGGIVFANNVCRRVCFGPHIWSSYPAGSGVTTGANLKNVVIAANTFGIDRDAWVNIPGLLAYGIGVFTDAGNNAPINGLKIVNNTFNYRPSVTAPASDYQSAAISLIGNNASAPIYDLEIMGNRFINPLSTCINLAITAGIIRFEIANNTGVNPGLSPQAGFADNYRSFCLPQKTLTDGSFHDNRLYDDQAVHTTKYGILLGGTTVACTNVRSFNNFIRFSDGVTPPCWVTAVNAAGTYIWMDEPADVATLPFQNVKVGSIIRELTTGKIYTQVVAPQGATWKVASELGVTTTTAAPVGGAAGALPAAPVGYETRNVNGTDQKFPYYG